MEQQVNRYIVWDLGATKCAVALVSHKVFRDQFTVEESHTIKLKEVKSLHEMVDAFEQALGCSMHEADGICIAGAGQYNGCELVLENPYPFSMTFADVAQARGWERYSVVHDYTPIVCRSFIPAQSDDETLTVVKGNPDWMGRRVAFGLGTGLGLKDAVLLSKGDFWIGCNEAGHMGICTPPLLNVAEAERHRDFCIFLRSQKNKGAPLPLTFESVLSGNGLARIYQFLHEGSRRLTPEEVAKQIKGNNDDETLALFGWYLGLFIANVQLMLMPSGGIWINGGVIHKNLEIFEAPFSAHLRRGMATVPAYQSMREEFPITVLIGQSHAFLGGAYYASRRLAKAVSRKVTSMAHA